MLKVLLKLLRFIEVFLVVFRCFSSFSWCSMFLWWDLVVFERLFTGFEWRLRVWTDRVFGPPSNVVCLLHWVPCRGFDLKLEIPWIAFSKNLSSKPFVFARDALACFSR